MLRDKTTLDLAAAAGAGIVAAIVSTLAQIALWAMFTDALPAILFRDARFAAAIVLGPDALARRDNDLVVIVVATLLHFALSIAYAVAIAWLVRRQRWPATIVVGALAGAGLFMVNMYGLTSIWPWFEAARDAITVAAHLAFGVSAAASYRWLARRARRAVSRARTPSP